MLCDRTSSKSTDSVQNQWLHRETHDNVNLTGTQKKTCQSRESCVVQSLAGRMTGYYDLPYEQAPIVFTDLGYVKAYVDYTVGEFADNCATVGGTNENPEVYYTDQWINGQVYFFPQDPNNPFRWSRRMQSGRKVPVFDQEEQFHSQFKPKEIVVTDNDDDDDDETFVPPDDKNSVRTEEPITIDDLNK